MRPRRARPCRCSVVEVETTPLPGVLVITPRRFSDGRGFFAETWSQRHLAKHGVTASFVQDNHSFSEAAGTVRGLHFQAPPNSQVKLVRCGRGRLFDVAVDIRRHSPTYGQWFGAELSFDNGRQLLIPEGFLHGFMTLEPDCEIVYKCSDFYAPEAEGAVLWNSCGIEWPDIGPEAVLSEKDAAAPALSDFETPFVFQE